MIYDRITNKWGMKDYSETAAGKCLTLFRRNQLKSYLTPYTITVLGELKRKKCH